MSRPFVTIDAVSKSFVPGVLALDAVSLAFRRGEVHAILGENGAGKSTLLNILFGMQQPDEGGIIMNGREVRHATPADAIGNGLGMVHQHFKLVSSFTVAQNIRLAMKPSVRRRFSRDSDIERIAEEFGLPLDPGAVAGELPLAIQQRIEILKALVNEAELILFDEPTTILNPAEIESFYAVVRSIAAAGRAVVVVTHHLDEVIDYADYVSVIRRGRLVGTGPVEAKRREDLIQEIVGRSIDGGELRSGGSRASGRVELALETVSVASTPSSSGLRNATLAVQGGEVVGVAGVEGNGQRELFELLAGLRKPDAGRVVAHCTHSDGRPRAGLVPEDRHHEGLVLDLPISVNLLLNRLGEAKFSRSGVLRSRSIAAVADTMRASGDIRTHSVEATPRTLSGGNQQKIVLARAMDEDAPALVVYQPTRGLDVAASEEVLRGLRSAADRDGKAVLLISSNLDEILRVCDRIVVLYAGRTVGDVPQPASRAMIGALMTSGSPAHMVAA